jgi:hypothetical protein
MFPDKNGCGIFFNSSIKTVHLLLDLSKKDSHVDYSLDEGFDIGRDSDCLSSAAAA